MARLYSISKQRTSRVKNIDISTNPGSTPMYTCSSEVFSGFVCDTITTAIMEAVIEGTSKSKNAAAIR